MKRPLRTSTTMTIMFTFFALAECTGHPERPVRETRNPADWMTAPAPLVLRLEMPGLARTRELVPFRLVLENRGDVAVEVGLGGSEIAFDFFVLTPEGEQVWSRLEGVPTETILQSRVVMPGDQLVFSDDWNQRDDHGRRVRPGTYRVLGVLPVVDVPGGWATESQILEIRE